MKPKLSLVLSSALLICASMPAASAASYTWDGGGADGKWTTAANWDPDGAPTLDNTADIVFFKAGTTTQLTNYMGASDVTIHSISYSSSATTIVNVRTRAAAGGAQVGKVLNFDAATGNASITVDAASTVNHVINGGSVTVGGTGGSINLVKTLDVTINSPNTNSFTMGQVNNGSIVGSETPITGPGGINKSGVGVLSLAGPNTFAGGVNISGGRVHVTSNDALGTGGVTLSGTDAELRLSTNGVVTPVANTLTVSDTGDAKILQGLIASGATTFSGAITINETTAGNFELAAGGSHTFTVSGNISGTTAAGIKKSSSGVLILSGNNTYTGDTLISNGTLKVGSATAIPSGTGKGNLNVSAGASLAGILDLNGFDLTVNGLIGGSAATLGQIVNNVAGTKILTVGSGDIATPTPVTYIYSGLIKDNGGIGGAIAFRKIGTGIQNLSGANTFTGGVSIENGALELGNNLAAGTNTITMSAPDTEGAVSDLRFLGSGTLTIANPLVISDAGQVKRLRKFGAGVAVYSGNITSNETTEGLFEIQVGTGNTLTVTGDISDTGTGGIEKINTGILILQGAKSYTGTTTVSGGTLTLDTAYLADASSVKIGNGAILNLTHGATDTVDKLFINGAQKPAGIYTAVGNAGPGEIAVPEITGTGKLQVTTSPVPAGYTSWLTGYTFAPGADTTRAGDPDGDGFTNLQEFLFGTDPTTGTQVLSSVEKSGTDVVIRWKQRTTGCTYQLLQSATLANPWINAVGGTIGNDGAAVDGYQPRIATIPIGVAKLFYRVEGVEN